MLGLGKSAQSGVNFAPLKNYLDNQFANVGGWCSAHLFGCIAGFRDYQRVQGITGPAAEIGVFHGKFFIGLALMNPSTAPHYAIDVFDLQQFNLDGAGEGNLQKFRANCAAAGLNDAQYVAMRADSMVISRADIDKIKAATAPFSMFSVDGCHMVEHTINDIRLASELVDPGGIIFVDDYYNPHWPGVQEGVAKMYHCDAPRFVPVLYAANKLVLCHISRHAEYLKHVTQFLKANYPHWATKPVKRFGYDTLTVVPHMQETFVLKP